VIKEDLSIEKSEETETGAELLPQTKVDDVLNLAPSVHVAPAELNKFFLCPPYSFSQKSR
jgi:hypothetical protein